MTKSDPSNTIPINPHENYILGRYIQDRDRVLAAQKAIELLQHHSDPVVLAAVVHISDIVQRYAGEVDKTYPFVVTTQRVEIVLGSTKEVVTIGEKSTCTYRAFGVGDTYSIEYAGSGPWTLNRTRDAVAPDINGKRMTSISEPLADGAEVAIGKYIFTIKYAATSAATDGA